MPFLFRNTKMLEAQIDEFMDAISQSTIVYKEAIDYYLAGDIEKFEERLLAIGKLESNADKVRRTVENQLYGQSLIPEHRGDVLSLLESMDNVIDTAKTTVTQFSVESPDIPEELNCEYSELAEKAANAAESIVRATRAFFRDITAVKDHLHKVYFYEKEADTASDKLKRHVFNLDIELSRKIHLRYFALSIDNLADRSEDVADKLSIYSIKREI